MEIPFACKRKYFLPCLEGVFVFGFFILASPGKNKLQIGKAAVMSMQLIMDQ
jgi:hypothetical protein